MARLLIPYTVLLASLFCVAFSFLPHGITVEEPVSFMAIIKIKMYAVRKNGTGGVFPTFCGASIIKRDVLLTAAHCMLVPPENMTAEAGIIDRSSPAGGEQRPVLKYLMHEDYVDRENDIALVWLKSPFRSFLIRPIGLPIPRDYTTFIPATAYGWGFDEKRTDVFLLRRGSFHVLPDSRCDRDRIKKTVCAMGINNRTTTCQGDSGGPLVVRGRLIGVVSIVYVSEYTKFCNSDIPVMFTRVLDFVDWIRANW